MLAFEMGAPLALRAEGPQPRHETRRCLRRRPVMPAPVPIHQDLVCHHVTAGADCHIIGRTNPGTDSEPERRETVTWAGAFAVLSVAHPARSRIRATGIQSRLNPMNLPPELA